MYVKLYKPFKTLQNHQPAQPILSSSTVSPSFIDTSECPIAQ